jgi:hypothetical protein
MWKTHSIDGLATSLDRPSPHPTLNVAAPQVSHMKTG